MDELLKEVQDLKTSLQLTQKEVDEVKTNYSKLSTGCNSNTDDICKLAQSLLLLETKANYLEGQCSPSTIVVDAFPSLNMRKIKQLIEEKVKLDHNKVILERAQ